jgi:CRISPR-associated DxTHG motif protein
MRLLTFLGVGKYEPTAYIWKGQEYVSAYAPVATYHFLKPDAMTVLVTEEAHQQIYPALRADLPADVSVQPLPIPLGQNEAELWQIFDQISGVVRPGDEVAFDITHGLRSFPLLGLLAAAFLRSGLDVHVPAVLYGAYDVRDRCVIPNRTPMFDLSPMLALLEWSAAADRFNRTGDARFLASLLKSQQKALALSAENDKGRLVEVGALGGLATTLTDIPQSLRLIRPHQAMERIASLADRIRRAQPVLARAAATRPFSLLLNSIEHTFLPLGLQTPASSRLVVESLRRQRLMIAWYVEREQWVPAVTLAREWLVSWTIAQLQKQDLLDKGTREKAEDALNKEAYALKQAKRAGPPFVPSDLAGIPDIEPLLKLWSNLTDVRNDINHAGMRLLPGKSEDLVAQIETCVRQLNALPI